MKKCTIPVIILLCLGFSITRINAQSSIPTEQITSASNYLIAQPISDRVVTYNLTDEGVSKPLEWGLDLAWLSEDNIRRGVAFMGADRVDIVRASFQPTYPLVNGDLQTPQINDLNTRLNLIDLTGTDTKVVLNCDHPSVDSWYIGNAARWAELMDVTTKRVQDRGRTVVSISPFNEPDYGWGQYNGNGQLDFYNICGELRNNSRFDNIRISGGNTLNCDQALPWYNYLKSRLDEGNTHQLAGSFDSFANFYSTVRSNGDHATGDELHNVMEAMVGAEYGMQTGIWWGTTEYTRSEFVKASDGVRLGYAEHRPNWTAASVYRNTDGKVQAFGGTSERQAVTTTYSFLSKDRDVYYNGYGPQREYTMVLPGGTGYQQGQTNAESVVNISWGDDIQPVINGQYIVVNRNSGKVLEVAGGSTTAGANIRQNVNLGATYQQWNVTPVDSRIGGDFSYFTFTAVHSGKSPDIYNYSLANGGNIVAWDDTKSGNQQWYLEYAGDGWFYIRSRHSAKCLEVLNASLLNGGNVVQWDKDGGTNQQWRFLPVGATIEFEAPNAPVGLVAIPNDESIRLNWSANSDRDFAGYTIFRSDSAGGTFNTIARNVTTTSFVDNKIIAGNHYYYKLKAVDNSLNNSDYSTEVSAVATGNKALVAQFQFEGSTEDNSINLNHSAGYGSIPYVNGKTGKAVALYGASTFIQMPSTIANHKEITVSTWVYWLGGAVWQRIFDFGNGQDEYMFLTPKAGSGELRFEIKNNGVVQQLNTTALSIGKWTHIAITLSSTGAKLYINGTQTAESSSITISPLDFKPALNYIGRSQYPDPLLKSFIDDFRVYNYALTANEIAQISEEPNAIEDIEVDSNNNLNVWPLPANDILNVSYSTANNGSTTIALFDLNGRLVMSKIVDSAFETEFNVSKLSPGIYMLKLINQDITLTKKIIINHL